MAGKVGAKVGATKRAEGPDGTPERAPPAVPRLDRVLHALSDPARLAIAARLRRDGECSCAALDGGRPKSTMSHHFRVLREAGVVETNAHGVTHLNRLRREALDAAFPGLLDAVLDAAGPVA